MFECKSEYKYIHIYPPYLPFDHDFKNLIEDAYFSFMSALTVVKFSIFKNAALLLYSPRRAATKKFSATESLLKKLIKQYTPVSDFFFALNNLNE